MEKRQEPLNMIVSQVENGYIIYETLMYRVGDATYARPYPHGDEPLQDMRRQWVCKDIEDVGVVLKKLAAERMPIG